jgi:hypothetical protein
VIEWVGQFDTDGGRIRALEALCWKLVFVNARSAIRLVRQFDMDGGRMRAREALQGKLEFISIRSAIKLVGQFDTGSSHKIVQNFI